MEFTLSVLHPVDLNLYMQVHECATTDHMGTQSANSARLVLNLKEVGYELWSDCGSLKETTSPKRIVTLQPCAQHRADIRGQAAKSHSA